MTTDTTAPVLSERIIDIVRRDFPDSELRTALWLLRECADDEDRTEALIDADGDLTTLVLAVEDRLSLHASDRSD